MDVWDFFQEKFCLSSGLINNRPVGLNLLYSGIGSFSSSPVFSRPSRIRINLAFCVLVGSLFNLLYVEVSRSANSLGW